MIRYILIPIMKLLLISSLISQSAEISDQLKSNINSLIDSDQIVGIVIGMSRGGQTDYYARGLRSIDGNEGVDEHSIFEIGSVSKTFTGLMLADMVLQGKIKLDDDIQTYLPKGIKAPMLDGQSIKMYHLSNHTSGLPRLPSNLNITDEFNPYKDYSEELMYQFLNSYELSRDIGSTYEYSNLAAGLLGHILSGINGTSYEALLKSAITEPLGMKQTGLTNAGPNQAHGHMGGTKVPNWDFGALQGAGAIRSNTSDMMHYIEVNMGLIEHSLYPAIQLTHETSGDPDSQPIVGLGWHTMVYDGQDIIWHNGATGGYTSFVGWIKGSDTGVVVLNNSSENVDNIGIHTLIPSFPLKVIREVIDLEESTLAGFVGVYELAPSFTLTVSLEDNQLNVKATGQGAFPIYPETETKFFYKVIDAQLVFQKNERGKVESVTLFQAGQEIVGKRLD